MSVQSLVHYLELAMHSDPYCETKFIYAFSRMQVDKGPFNHVTGLISTGRQHSLIKFSKQQQAQDNCARIGLLSMLMYFYTTGTLPPMRV